jgi:hypothetical protein
MDINNDNLLHIKRFQYEPPHPSYISGFIDGDGCIFIRKIKDGYQSGISINQSRTNILQVIRYHFGGSITSSQTRNSNIQNTMVDNQSEFYHKHNKRNQYNLIIRSNEYELLLNYIKDYIIIKDPQIQCLYEMNKVVHLPNKKEEKEQLYELCLSNKKENTILEKNLIKINIEYIQGLFDAEGCFFITSQNMNKHRISIVQKNYPEILDEIKKFLGFGAVVESCRYVIYNKKDSLQFISLIKNGLIVKYNQACAFETFLLTNDDITKNDMYKICNEEKHKIEYFTELNIKDQGKEGYKKTMQLRQQKQEICKEIEWKHFYKEKSENRTNEAGRC